MRVRFITAALLIAFSPTSALAASADADKAVWVGNAYYQLSRAKNPPLWWGIRQIEFASRNGGLSDLETARNTINTTRTLIDRESQRLSPMTANQTDEYEFANATYEATKGLGSGGHVFGTYMQYLLKRETNEPAYVAALLSTNNQRSLEFFHTDSDEALTALGAIYDRAQADPSFAKAFNEGIAFPLLNAPTTASAKEILTGNPDFASTRAISRLVDEKGELKTSIDDIKGTIAEQLKQSNTDIAEARKDIATALNLGMKSQAESKRDAATLLTMARQQQIQHQKAMQEALESDALRSGVLIVSSLIPDKGAARKFNAVSNAIIDAHGLIRNFATNRSLMADQGVEYAEMVSTAILTGGLLSIGLSVAGALADSGPSPDEIIFEQLGILADQLRDFRKEMNDRFDRVDTALKKIFDNVTEGFRQLSNQIAIAQEDLRKIRLALGASLARMDRFEQRITEYLMQILDQQFNSSMVDCLDSVGRTGSELDERTYDKCTGAIISFLRESRSTALSGEWSPGITPDALRERLAHSDLNSNINLFRAIAVAKGGYDFSQSDPRSNPIRWSIAANVYTRLANENMKWFIGEPDKDLKELESEGRLLIQDMTKVTKYPDKFTTLLGNLLAEYRASVLMVADAAAKVRKTSLEKQGAKAKEIWLSPSELQRMLPAFINEIQDRPIAAIDPSQRPIPTYVDDALDKAIYQPGYNKASVRALAPQFKQQANLPPIPQPASLWRRASSLPEVFAAEMVGDGTVEVTYAVESLPKYINGMFLTVAIQPKVDLFLGIKRTTNVQNMGLSSSVDVSAEPIRLHFYEDVPIPCSGVATGGCPPFNQLSFITKGGVEFLNLGPFEHAKEWEIVQTEKRLGDVLLRLNQDLREAMNDSGSELSLKIDQTEGTILAVRGVIELALPSALKAREDLRITLYGRPAYQGCIRSSSRILADRKLKPNPDGTPDEKPAAEATCETRRL
jgi:hypothetical protein